MPEFAKIKDADEKRFKVERATETLMSARGIKREMEKDKAFKDAVKVRLAEIAKDAKAAKTT